MNIFNEKDFSDRKIIDKYKTPILQDLKKKVGKDVSKIWVFRITHFNNLEYILQNGLYYRNSLRADPHYTIIGSSDIIDRRDHTTVDCYPETTLKEYIPFYFGVRSPMLYKIKTGNGVPKLPQEDIIYICCKLTDLATKKFQWCFTNGNAAVTITKFFNDLKAIDKLDWKSIHATEWTDNNSDGDTDRMRKKHSEFLVKDHVPVREIKGIVVFNEGKQKAVEKLVKKYELSIEVQINPSKSFYY